MQECMRQQEYRSEKSPLRLIMERVEAGVQLMPDWHDDTLMVPNCLVRSALFSCRRRTGQEWTDGEVAGCGREVVIAQGPVLQQYDLLVWLEMLQMARLRAFGEPITITMHRLIRALGLTNSGQRYDSLARRLLRLSETRITVTTTDGRVLGPAPLILLEPASLGQNERPITYRLSPQLQTLFQLNGMTRLSRQVLHALPSGTGSWLYAYIRSHHRPYPVKFASIRAWSGSSLSVSDFKRSLLAELARLKMRHILRDFSFDAGLVTLMPMAFSPEG